MKKAIAVFVLCFVIAAFADNPHVTQLIELVDVAISSPADGDVLTYSTSAAKWVNKPTATVPDGPTVVARFDQDGITSGNSQLPVFTPTETANYRITEVSETPTNVAAPNLYDSFSVALGNTISSGNTISLYGLVQHQNMVMVRLHAGDTVFSDTTGSSYPLNLHIVVEKM